MAEVWTGSGPWQGWSLTTDHAASNYGQPVLVSPSGKAYGPGDIERPAWTTVDKKRFSQADLAAALCVSRFRVTELVHDGKLPPFDGRLPSGRGWWTKETVQQIVEARSKKTSLSDEE
jgi:hypothetical protein